MELLTYLLKSGLCLGVFVGLYAALLRRETFYAAARGYFGAALLVSLGLPLVKVPVWPAAGLPGTERSVTRYLPDLSFRFDRPAVTQATPVADGGTAPEPFAAWPLERVLLISYGVGVAVLLGRLGYQLVSLMRLRRRARPVRVQGQRIWVPDVPAQPFSFFGWIFLNPARYSEPELDEILRHEAVHVRQGHSVDVLATELMTIAFWFNPVAWLFRVYLKQNLEFLADRTVLQSGLDARRYQFSLLKWGGVPVPSPVANGFSVPQLKNRIRQINTPDSARWRVLKFGLVLPLVGVLGMGFVAEEPLSVEQIGIRSTGSFSEALPILFDSLPDRTRKAALTDTEEAKPVGKPSRMGFMAQGTVYLSPDSGGGVKQIDLELDERRLVRIRENGRNTLRLEGNPQPLIILDGFALPEGTRLESIEAADVVNVDVFKPNHPAMLEYSERGKKGVVRITTRKNAVPGDTLPKRIVPEIRIKQDQGNSAEASKLNIENVIFLVDGVEVKNFENVPPNEIESVEILKGSQVTDRYGDRARDGVILIRRKKK
jgi:hypothetical protein